MEEKARPPPFMISYHPFYRDLNQQNGKSPGHCKAWPGDFYFLKVNFQAVSTVANVLQTPPASTGVVGVLNTEYPEIPRLISAQRKRKSTRILNIICGHKYTFRFHGLSDNRLPPAQRTVSSERLNCCPYPVLARGYSRTQYLPFHRSSRKRI